MATNTQTVLERLSRAMKPCPECILIEDKEGWGRNCQCQGTGFVLRWRELTRPCTTQEGCGPIYHSACPGTCRVLKQGSELLMAIRESIGPHDYQRTKGMHSYRPHGMRDPFYSSDELEAATQALKAKAKESE